jgi:tRNA-binding protein
VNPRISWSDFEKVDVRVGRIVAVDDFPEARRPAYKLTVDFGEALGTKRSSAQLTRLYSKDDLLGRLVLAVVNFSPKQIGPFLSEALVLGVPSAEGDVVLLTPERAVPPGGKMF